MHKDIHLITISPNGRWIFISDEDGRMAIASFHARVIVYQMSLASAASAVAFSPCSCYIACALMQKNHIQVWKFASGAAIVREFSPFTLVKTFTGHHDDITSLSWTSDGCRILSSSKDLTVRVGHMNLSASSSSDGDVEHKKPIRLTGHKDEVVGAFWAADESCIHSISRDGSLFVWKQEASDAYRLAEKHYFNKGNSSAGYSKVTSAFIHRQSGLVVVGFSTGVFSLWELPDFNMVHQLTLSQNSVDTVTVSAGGEWIAFGSSALGQLVVWEWQSETFILKQQGHLSTMDCVAYSPDGDIVATGGSDGKLKLWSI
eukprot:Partr_v1_DN28312_c2_g1_i1_m79132 putative periodic tryptophan protein